MSMMYLYRFLLFCLLGVSTTGMLCAQPFLEQGGVVSFEIETQSAAGWTSRTDIGGFTGASFYEWTGGNNFNNPGVGTMTYQFTISQTGFYRVQWRSRIAQGNSTTDFNDNWLKIDNNANTVFFGYQGNVNNIETELNNALSSSPPNSNAVVFPIGSGLGNNTLSNQPGGTRPEGAGSGGWFKIYMNQLNTWSWQTLTSDNDPHNVYVQFKQPGTYSLQVAGRSNGHALDKVVLHHIGNNLILNNNAAGPPQSPLSGAPLAATPGKWQVRTFGIGANPEQRHESAYVELNGLFYLIGGRGNKAIQVYSPVTDTWSNTGAITNDIHHFQAIAWNGKIYIVGAFTGGFPNENPLTTIKIFDPATNQLTDGATIPANRRRGSAGVAVYNDKFYVVSGNRLGHRKFLMDNQTIAHAPWFDIYDPVTDTWQVLPDAPRARDHFHAAVINNRLYAASGRRSSWENGNFEATFAPTEAAVDVFDFTTNQWLAGNDVPDDIPTQRAGASSVVFNDELIVIGGEIQNNPPNNLALNVTEALDPATGTWRTLAPLNLQRHATQAVLFDEKIYLPAGSKTRGGTEITPNEAYQEVFAFTEFDSWVDVATGIKPRAEAQPILYMGKLHVFNGFAPNIQIENSSEVFDFAARQWSPLATMPNQPNGNPWAMTHHGIAQVGDTVWMAGGRVGNNPGPVTNQVWWYLLSTNTWIESPYPLPLPAGGGGMGRLGRKLHYVGGFDPQANCDVDLHLVFDLDNPAAGWVSYDDSPMPIPRNHFGTTVMGGKLYTIAGQNGHDGCQFGTNIKAVHEYDPATDAWTQLADFPINNSHIEPGTFAIDGKIYVVGGQNQGNGSVPNAGKNVYVLDPAANNGLGVWTKLDDFELPENLLAPAARIVGDEFIVTHGGAPNTGSPTNKTRIKNILRVPNRSLGFNPAAPTVLLEPNATTTVSAILFSQADTADYTISTAGLPAWLSLNKISGTAEESHEQINLTFNTAGLTQGVYTYTLTASAPNYNPATMTITLEVIQPGAPVLTNPADQENREGDTISLAIEATLAGGGELSYTASNLPTGLTINAATGVISGVIAAGAAANSPYAVQVVATSNNQISDTANFVWTVKEPLIIGPALFRINAGGPTVTTSSTTWQAGASFFTGGNTFANAVAIANTNDDVLYQTEYSAVNNNTPFNFAVPVANGTYYLALHFAEIYWGAPGFGFNDGGPGKRVFSLQIEGQNPPNLQNIDLNALVGPTTALILNHEVTVTDGELNIFFTSTVDQPKISAIEIFSTGEAPPPANTAPTVVNPIADFAVAQDAAPSVLDVSQVFADAEDDNATLALSVPTNSNPGLVGTSLSGQTLTLTYTAGQAGQATIVLRATDSGGLFVEESFTVTVTPPTPPGNTVPTVVNPIADFAVAQDAAPSVLDVSQVFADAEDDNATLSLSVPTNSNPGLVGASLSGQTLTLTYAAGQAGQATIVLRATDSGGLFADESFTVTVEATPDTGFAFRVNAGGPAVTTGGFDWAANGFFAGGQAKPFFGTGFPDIQNTDSDTLYRTEYSGQGATNMASFTFAYPGLAPGFYTVRLHIAEIYWGAPGAPGNPQVGTGQRVFSVDVEGTQPPNMQNLDPTAITGGPFIAFVRETTVEVTDGTLNMTFTATVDQPTVSALEIIRVGRCTPFSTLDCDQLTVDLTSPYAPEWTNDAGGIVGQADLGTGFTVVYPPDARLIADGPAPDPAVPGYQPDLLVVDPSAGTLSLTTSKGTALGVSNTQLNMLAVKAATTGVTLEARTELLALPDPGTPLNQEAGLWFGIDQDNYVKLVAKAIPGAGDSAYEVLLLHEANGITVASTQVTDAVAVGDNVLFTFQLNPATQTVQAFYEVNRDGNPVAVGGDLAVADTLFTGFELDGGVGTLVGIFGTHANANVALTYTFGEFTLLSNDDPLPIALLDFTARSTEQGVQLDWQTLSETDNDFFTLERSKDGQAFLPIARLEGAGTYQGLRRYQHLDTQPLSGRSYYRLRQTDFDGTSTLSPVRMVDRNQEYLRSFRAFPNPNTGERIQVELAGLNADEVLTIGLYDALGRIVYQTDTRSDAGGQYANTLTPTRKLSAGVYWLQVRTPYSQWQQKIVVR